MDANFKRSIKRIAPFLALLLLLGLTVNSWRIYERNVIQREENRFLHSVNHVINEIVDRIHRYEMVLQGGAGLFAASEEVTREEWQAYCEYQQTVDLYPGVRGVGYAEIVAGNELNQHEASIRAEGFPDYAVWPAGEREIYAVVKYIEPFDEFNRGAFGFDLYSESARREAAERASDNDSASISSKLTLLQALSESNQPGFIMFLPVYNKKLPHTTIEERRQALEGYIFAPFQMVELMENIFPDPLYAIDFEIYDGTDISPDTLLYDSLVDEVNHIPTFTSQSAVDLYGRQWTITFKSTSAFGLAADRFVGYGILIVGLLFSVLFFFYLRNLERHIERSRLYNLALQESEERYRFLVEHSDDLVWVLRESGIFSYVSPSWQQVLGYELLHLEGKEFQFFIHPEDVPEYEKYLAEVMENGSIITDLQYRVKHADGQFYWHEGSIKSVYTNERSIKYYVGISRDITKRKLAEDEIRSLNEELEERVKERTAEVEAVNKELESFSYSVSHDLRTPLRALIGFSEHLLENYADRFDEKGKHYLLRISNAALNMNSLIIDMLKFSRITRSDLIKEQVDLSKLAAEIMESLQEAEPAFLMEIEIAPNLMAKGDPRLLRVVYENLLGNALKFSSEQKRIRVEVGKIDQGSDTVFFVRDNGVGFNMDYADKLFSAFQRLHGSEEFPGTGIGLATVQRIINRHGGRIWAESEVGKGATFYFTL